MDNVMSVKNMDTRNPIAPREANRTTKVESINNNGEGEMMIIRVDIRIKAAKIIFRETTIMERMVGSDTNRYQI